MTAESFQVAFEQTLPSLPGSETARQLRQAAFAAFLDRGLPTHRDEDWRYTKLDELAAPSLASRPQSGAPASLPHEVEQALTHPHLVFYGDHIMRKKAGQGFEVTTLGDLTANGQMVLLGTNESAPALTALNAARLGDGAIVNIADGVTTEDAFHCIFLDSEDAGQTHQRLVFNVGESAAATIVMHYVGSSHARGWTNVVCDAHLGRHAMLRLERFQSHNEQHHHTERLSAKLLRGASLQLTTADLGGQLVRNDTVVDLAEPNSNVAINGVFFAGKNQHLDNHTRIDHRAPDTSSSEVFRGIAGEGGRGVFNGKVVVHKDAQRIDAQQQSNNLLLGDRCEIDTKPELEIYADDVKCSHGATVGQLDDNQLYYLQTRGIDKAEAERLLTLGFANGVIQLFDSEVLQSKAAERISTQIAEHPRED